jgi:hypothetical protein
VNYTLLSSYPDEGYQLDLQVMEDYIHGKYLASNAVFQTTFLMKGKIFGSMTFTYLIHSSMDRTVYDMVGTLELLNE